MKFIKIAFIVEGDGEIAALPVLVRRIVQKIDETVFVGDKTNPIKVARNALVKPGVLEWYVGIAAESIGRDGGILILLDSDDDCPAKLAPQLLKVARETRPDLPIALIMAHREYESWFLASAESLRGKHGLSDTFEAPANIEEKRGAKEWLKKYMPPGSSYKETIHQPLFTREIDIGLARKNSPSFDKLYRDLQAMIRQLQEAQSQSN